MSNKAIPLSVAIEQTRTKIIRDVNKAISESGLPAYLLEGVFLELLADVRESKVREISAELLRVVSEIGEEDKNNVSKVD